MNTTGGMDKDTIQSIAVEIAQRLPFYSLDDFPTDTSGSHADRGRSGRVHR
jgi:hypothetical protein